jgi:hypothetical protein
MCAILSAIYWPVGVGLFCIGFVFFGIPVLGKLFMTKDGSQPLDSVDE